MDSIQKQARTAGLLYFLLALSAPIGLEYVPSTILVVGDAVATADRMRAAEWLVRLGIWSELFHQIIGIFLVLQLYRLFKRVSEKHAVLMVVLSLLPVPIVLVSVVHEIASLILVGGASWLSVFDKGQIDALAYLFFRLHRQGHVVASIFWGLWLFPFAWLVIRSGFLPRFLGYLMLVAGVGYLVSSFTNLLLPQVASQVSPIAMAMYVGEVPIIFWLLIWGAREKRAPA